MICDFLSERSISMHSEYLNKMKLQYSILENYNAKTDDKIVLRRESWWKETLQSRKWGYNSN